jgi:nucleoside 2-deoxyribosyltransferase
MGDPCPVCEFDKPTFSSTPGKPDTLSVQCARCGSYRITRTALMVVPNMEKAERNRLSGVLRNASDNHQQLRVTSDNVTELIARAPATFSISRLIESVLLLVAYRTLAGDIRKHIILEENDYPVLYLKSGADFFHVVEMLGALGLLQFKAAVGSSLPVALTVAGWQRVEALQSTRGRPDQAFVAMSFDSSLDEAFAEGIRPALLDTGFEPVRIDQVQHNEKIDDRILAGIRSSGLLVADFTGHKQNVYFEAGFALGLVVPVIWCCRKDQLEQAHLDTRQYNHIVWTTPSDLRDQLGTRIRALGFARD